MLTDDGRDAGSHHRQVDTNRILPSFSMPNCPVPRRPQKNKGAEKEPRSFPFQRQKFNSPVGELPVGELPVGELPVGELLERDFACELNDARGFTGLDNLLRGWRGHRRTAGLSKDR